MGNNTGGGYASAAAQAICDCPLIDSTYVLERPSRLPRSFRPTITQGSSEAPQADSRCRALDGHIASLDSAARAGGTARYMEWLNEERRRARDEQFRLRCR